MRNTAKTSPAEAAAGATILPQLQRNVLYTRNFTKPGARFFLNSSCETVEPSLTNLKSNTYKRPSHRNTETVES